MPITPPPADRFRVGDTWLSPEGEEWKCDKEKRPGVVRLRSLSSPPEYPITQWRNAWDIGNNDMLTAWHRIDRTYN